jgi:hypothetical protein
MSRVGVAVARLTRIYAARMRMAMRRSLVQFGYVAFTTSIFYLATNTNSIFQAFTSGVLPFRFEGHFSFRHAVRLSVANRIDHQTS